ncbi:MAG: hypothetical protein ACXWXV_11295 [Aeromicrobium sp.]
MELSAASSRSTPHRASAMPLSTPVDLILWQADDLETINVRIKRLAAGTDVDAERVFGWCVAFAAMSALELASQGDGPLAGSKALLELASQASP